MTTSMKSAAALVVCSVIGFVYWRANRNTTRMAANAIIAIDVSGSTTHQLESGIGIADGFLNNPYPVKGSTLTVITTGDDSTGGEPRLLAGYEIPYSRRALEGKSTLLQQRKEILADLVSKLKTVERTERSPIFLAIKRGVEQLQSAGCRQGADCRLYVRTDGEELWEKSIKKALADTGKIQDLPAPLSNEGISVVFCGLAEIATGDRPNSEKPRTVRTAGHIDRLREVWRSLFAEPTLVSFEPYCPKGQVDKIAGN